MPVAAEDLTIQAVVQVVQVVVVQDRLAQETAPLVQQIRGLAVVDHATMAVEQGTAATAVRV